MPGVNIVRTGAAETKTIFPTTELFRNLYTTCAPYITAASATDATAQSFLSNINFNTVRSNLLAAQVNVAVLLADSNVTSIAYTDSLTTYTSNLQPQLLQLGFLSKCLSEQTDSTDALFTAKQELSVSKDRYDLIHSPETHVSYYEGVFPIYRPIKQSTMFALFGIGLFLMLLSLLLFLRTQGIELHVIMPQLPGLSSISIDWKYIGIGCGIGVLLGYFFHVYYT